MSGWSHNKMRFYRALRDLQHSGCGLEDLRLSECGLEPHTAVVLYEALDHTPHDRKSRNAL